MTDNGRALVLGGGGVTGIAWELGLLRGLADAGVDVTDADLLIGTSAGSVVAAQVAGGAPLVKLYEGQLKPPTSEIAARLSNVSILKMLAAYAWPGDERRKRARIGRAALRADTVPEADRRKVFAGRLSTTEWPERQLQITAVEAATGEFKVFDADSGVQLIDAVAASCAVPLVWPPVTIDGKRYMDGGARSVANVDLAADYERVVVVAPFTQSLTRAGRPEVQAAKLGPDTRAIVLSPDDAAKQAIGKNVLDPARRRPAAEAGLAQAAAYADEVRAVWSD